MKSDKSEYIQLTIQFSEKKIMERCPYLGTKSDPSTALNNASSWNYCHHVQPVAVPTSTHQKSTCLTADYLDCEAYKNALGTKMPKEMKYKPGFRPLNRKTLLFLLGGVMIIVLFLAVSNSYAWFSEWYSLSPQDRLQTEEASVLLTKMAMPTATNTITPQNANTETSTPTFTPTEIPPTPTITQTHTQRVLYPYDPTATENHSSPPVYPTNTPLPRATNTQPPPEPTRTVTPSPTAPPPLLPTREP